MNEATIELGFIFKQIPEYDFSMKTFEERLRVQKTIYLLQAFGIYLGYDFSWYMRGPYCSLLATNGFELESVYDNIEPTEKIRFRKNAVQKKFEQFIQFIHGLNTDQLEIAASLHFLKQTKKDDEAKKITEEKQEKFTKEKVEKVWDRMKRCDLI